MAASFSKIILPTRSQPDTIVAIFILKTFGGEKFPGIKDAAVDFWQTLPAGTSPQALEEEGIILMDIGGGKFDHHASPQKTTASDLVAGHLGVAENPALAKLLEYARRDDFYGKGTISSDPIDRAFGLSALIASLNKNFVREPARVVELILPIIEAHWREEVRRTEEMPREFEEKLKQGKAEIFEVRQRGKKLRGVMIESESASISGYLRSQNGGRFDVVVQWLASRHVNILTRPAKRVDLKALALVLRLEEANRKGIELSLTPEALAASGRIPEIPEWYYDPATNSVQNGGINPKDIPATKIPRSEFMKIVLVGLEERIWRPA